MSHPIPPTDGPAIDKIVAALKSAKTVCLSGHENPDADVIGSQIAMASLIRRLSPKASIDIINSGPAPAYLSYLPRMDSIQSASKIVKTYDVLVVMECSGADRMGNIIDFKTQAKTIINIDHHLHNPNYGHINFVEPVTSSTAELIFKIFERAGLTLTSEEAVCLYTGIVTDTGCFRYGNTNVQTHRIAGKLLERDVPVAMVSERLYMSRTKAAMELLAWALSHLELVMNDRAALLTLPEEVMKKSNAKPDDIEELVNYGLQCESTVISALLKEKEAGLVKVSLRSKGDVNVNQIARQFGGGGHQNASGCTVPGTLDAVKASVVHAIKAIL